MIRNTYCLFHKSALYCDTLPPDSVNLLDAFLSVLVDDFQFTNLSFTFLPLLFCHFWFFTGGSKLTQPYFVTHYFDLLCSGSFAIIKWWSPPCQQNKHYSVSHYMRYVWDHQLLWINFCLPIWFKRLQHFRSYCREMDKLYFETVWKYFCRASRMNAHRHDWHHFTACTIESRIKATLGSRLDLDRIIQFSNIKDWKQHSCIRWKSQISSRQNAVGDNFDCLTKPLKNHFSKNEIGDAGMRRRLIIR